MDTRAGPAAFLGCPVNQDGKTDEALMAMLSRGADEALAELVQRYQNDIFRFCVYYVKEVERARELTQETFLRVFKARDRFDSARRFRPWLLCIARNLCLNDLKRKRTAVMESLEDYASNARSETGELFQSQADGPEALAVAGERRAALEQALNELEPEAREIVILRFFERMQAREIAEITGSTEGAVRTRLHRIMRRLRTYLTPQRDAL